MIREYTYDLLGKELKITIGKVAEQANGACLMQMGDTVVMVTATASDKPRQGIDFFPLSCDFEEKMYAAGKIPGGFIKREGRPSERAVLTSRLIDRPLRPLFPEGFRNDVQVIATALSYDKDNSPDYLAMIGASVALSISDIPFNGPIAALNVGYVDDQIKLIPNAEERERSKLNLTVAGTKDAVMMVEAGCDILPEATVLQAILDAHSEIQKICEFISKIQSEVGKEKFTIVRPETNEDLIQAVHAYSLKKMHEAIAITDREDRREKLDEIELDTIAMLDEDYPDQENEISQVLDKITKQEVRRLILEEQRRPDNRGMDEIRELSADAGLLPRTHGSGLFKRGQTQVLSIATLGGPSEGQTIDGFDEEEKRYMHHYNFPPYSVGEARPLRSPGRREIGHGALAERALIPVLPPAEDFPYSIRVVSEVLSSNGSSSQASVCGSTLALMDAGVPITAPVAGIAMGLIKNPEEERVAILTDIQGLEDHLGDMDFKVAGTKEGITAIQMDIKIAGIDRRILEEALEKARIARLFILEKMMTAIDAPRAELSKYAPRIMSIKVHPDKVREIIGPGGKVINKIIDETGVKIDTFDDGNIVITSTDGEGAKKAIEMIERIVKEVEVGETYLGKVTKIMNFGAFVEVLNGKEGLVHISQLARERVNNVEDVVKVGDEVLVKVVEIDKQGRINLSRKVLLPKEEPKDSKPKE